MAKATRDKAEKSRLRQLVRNITEPIKNKSEIVPEDIATKVLDGLDPAGTVSKGFPYIYMAAALMFRQVTRQEMRGKPRIGKAPNPVLPGFEELQDRYPKARKQGKKPRYVLRDKMTRPDWLWNLDQLAAKENGLGKHREQLKKWGEEIRGWKAPPSVASS
jgi:hypothetical protein